MSINLTDKRIAKMFLQGISLEKIAKRIGRPGDIQRIKEGLIREKLLDSE